MVSYAYGPLVAYDPTAGVLVKSASGRVYALNDTSFVSPLSVTDLQGVTLTDIVSSADGVLPEFKVDDHPSVMWKSGNFVLLLESVKGLQEAAEDAAAAAEAAQSAAEAAQLAAEEAAANSGGGSGGGGVTSHAALSGLANDDHPQYFNQARGDARYYTQAQVDSKINDSATANSAGDRNRNNHTGTQAMSTVNGLTSALSARLRVVLVSTGNESRPTDSTVVLWVGGSEQPANMGPVDIWLADAEVEPGEDTSAPSVPTGVAVTGLTATSATVTWNPSSDNVGVTGYEVFLDGDSAGTVTGTSKVLSELDPETEYSVRVRARDAAGNWSAQSSAVVFETPPAVLPDLHSVYASTAYGELDVVSDTTPIVATAFYTFSSAANGWRCVGGRVYIPASVTPPTYVVVAMWVGTDPDLGAASERSATITSPVAGWNEVLWDTPYEMTPSSPVWIGYQFSDSRYLTKANGTGEFVQSATTEYLYQASQGDFGGVSRRKIGSGSTTPSSDIFGADILVDEGE